MTDQEATTMDKGVVTDEITTSHHTATKITSKGGERIRRKKPLYHVEINTRDEDQGRHTFTIKGADKDVPKVT